MKQYLDLLRDVRDNGRGKADRTGTGTRAVFGRQIRMDLSEGFPLLTTKKVFTRGILAELLWILSGDTNENTLQDQKVNIWKEWRDNLAGKKTLDGHPRKDGDMGRIYGAQWRDWSSYYWCDGLGPMDGHGDHGWQRESVDQIAKAIHDLKTNPTSRRIIVTSWNPGELDQMALPPCHMMFQFYCEELTTKERHRLALDPEAEDLPRLAENFESYHETLISTIHAEGKDNPDGEAVLSDVMDHFDVPRYRLSCQLYQRSEQSALAA